jgi:hypothetical protein
MVHMVLTWKIDNRHLSRLKQGIAVLTKKQRTMCRPFRIDAGDIRSTMTREMPE